MSDGEDARAQVRNDRTEPEELPLEGVGADGGAVGPRGAAAVEGPEGLAQEVPAVLAAVHQARLHVLGGHDADGCRAAADRDPLPAATVREVMRRDCAADLVRGEGGTLAVGFRK